MPPIDTEAQFKFLLSCIKHSAAGKINFENVAQELGIVSKAAAAKRYERLLKAHDITVATPRKKANNDGDDSGEPKTPASKKRKRTQRAVPKDESEEDTPIKKEAGVKKEEGVKQEESDEDVAVKAESEGSLQTRASTSCCKGVVGDVKMSEIPEAFPRRQGTTHGQAPGNRDGDDACVIVGERPVMTSARNPTPPPPPPPPPPPQAVAHHADSHEHGYRRHGGLPTPPNFGYHAAASGHRFDANLALSQQTHSARSNSALETSSMRDATPTSLPAVSWSYPSTPTVPSAGFHCGGHHPWP